MTRKLSCGYIGSFFGEESVWLLFNRRIFLPYIFALDTCRIGFLGVLNCGKITDQKTVSIEENHAAAIWRDFTHRAIIASPFWLLDSSTSTKHNIFKTVIIKNI